MTVINIKRKGFTLVELLVVVAIIGLLSGMVVISIKNVKAKARDSQRVSDVNTISTGLNMYHNDFNAYPVFDGYITGADGLSIALKNSGAVSALPIDPLNNGNYRYYYQSVDGEDFYLEYYLETNSMSGKSQGRNYLVP
jgi:prepilin-type N-terminal cleavage/methylation domain-containing protein